MTGSMLLPLPINSRQSLSHLVAQAHCDVERHHEANNDPSFLRIASQMRQLNPSDNPNDMVGNFNCGASHEYVVDDTRLGQPNLFFHSFSPGFLAETTPNPLLKRFAHTPSLSDLGRAGRHPNPPIKQPPPVTA